MNPLRPHCLPLLALCCAAASAGCGLVASPAAAAPAAPAPAAQGRSSLSSPWVRARAPEGSLLLEAPARVLAAPAAVQLLGVPARARVEAIHAGVGAQVRRGDPLVTVVMPDLAAAASAFVSSQARGRALEKRAAQLKALQTEGLARLQDLSEVEVKQAECEADGRAARALLRAAAQPEESAAALSESGGRVVLRSPLDGVLVALEVVPGESCEAGAKLGRIEGAGPGLVEARLPAALAFADELTFVPQAGPARKARLVSRAPSLDPRDGSRLAWLRPEGAPLTAGQTGRVRGSGGSAGAVLVPSTALAWDGGEALLVVRRGEAREEARVQVLATSGAEALVTGGVKAGDDVAAQAGGVQP